MRDKQLFQHILSIVNQKKNISPKQHPGTFAQNYCKQQLLKKKLTPYDPNSKMNHLMSKFSKLQTYVNLEQVVKLLRNKNQDKKQRLLKKQPLNNINMCNFQNNKQNINQKQPIQQFIRKKIGRQIAQKYQIENQKLNKILQILQSNSLIYSEYLKNNSSYGQNFLLKSIQRRSYQDGDQSMPQIAEYRKKYLGNLDQQKLSNSIYKSFQLVCKLNSSKFKQNKNRASLLHKISTYLQIILENLHRNKWQEKRKNTLNRTNSNSDECGSISEQNKSKISDCSMHYSFNSGTFLTQIQNSNKRINLNHNKIHQRAASDLPNKFKNKTKLFIKNQTISLSNFHQQKNKTFYGNRSPLFQKRNTNYKLAHKSSLFTPSPVLKRKTMSNLRQISSFYEMKKKLNEDFTFKNRYCKQGVMKKINQFINLIDYQEQANKYENRQINKALSKFEHQIKRQYQDFKQEPLQANDEDVQDVKRMASQYKYPRLSKQ